jgi:ribose 5-phosphate isomerase B
MRIAIGADHQGFTHKEQIKRAIDYIDGQEVLWLDVGAYDRTRSDYPVFARRACEEMKAGKVECAVLLCATGAGMAIAANRYSGIYAALVWNKELAYLSKEHDNANVLVLPSAYIDYDTMIEAVVAWLSTKFKGGRYQERIDMIDAIIDEAKK